MDIAPSIRRFIAEEFLTPEEAAGLTDADDLLALLDSMSLLRTIRYVESTFGIKMQDSELTPDNLGSIDQLAQFVRRKLETA